MQEGETFRWQRRNDPQKRNKKQNKLMIESEYFKKADNHVGFFKLFVYTVQVEYELKS